MGSRSPRRRSVPSRPSRPGCPPSVIASGEPVRSSVGVVSRTIWYNGMITVVGRPTAAWHVARPLTASPSPPVRANGQYSAVRWVTPIRSAGAIWARGAVAGAPPRRRAGPPPPGFRGGGGAPPFVSPRPPPPAGRRPPPRPPPPRGGKMARGTEPPPRGGGGTPRPRGARRLFLLPPPAGGAARAIPLVERRPPPGPERGVRLLGAARRGAQPRR